MAPGPFLGLGEGCRSRSLNGGTLAVLLRWQAPQRPPGALLGDRGSGALQDPRKSRQLRPGRSRPPAGFVKCSLRVRLDLLLSNKEMGHLE